MTADTKKYNISIKNNAAVGGSYLYRLGLGLLRDAPSGASKSDTRPKECHELSLKDSFTVDDLVKNLPDKSREILRSKFAKMFAENISDGTVDNASEADTLNEALAMVDMERLRPFIDTSSSVDAWLKISESDLQTLAQLTHFFLGLQLESPQFKPLQELLNKLDVKAISDPKIIDRLSKIDSDPHGCGTIYFNMYEGIIINLIRRYTFSKHGEHAGNELDKAIYSYLKMRPENISLSFLNEVLIYADSYGGVLRDYIYGDPPSDIFEKVIEKKRDTSDFYNASDICSIVESLLKRNHPYAMDVVRGLLSLKPQYPFNTPDLFSHLTYDSTVPNAIIALAKSDGKGVLSPVGIGRTDDMGFKEELRSLLGDLIHHPKNAMAGRLILSLFNSELDFFHECDIDWQMENRKDGKQIRDTSLDSITALIESLSNTEPDLETPEDNDLRSDAVGMLGQLAYNGYPDAVNQLRYLLNNNIGNLEGVFTTILTNFSELRGEQSFLYSKESTEADIAKALHGLSNDEFLAVYAALEKTLASGLDTKTLAENVINSDTFYNLGEALKDTLTGTTDVELDDTFKLAALLLKSPEAYDIGNQPLFDAFVSLDSEDMYRGKPLEILKETAMIAGRPYAEDSVENISEYIYNCLTENIATHQYPATMQDHIDALFAIAESDSEQNMRALMKLINFADEIDTVRSDLISLDINPIISNISQPNPLNIRNYNMNYSRYVIQLSVQTSYGGSSFRTLAQEDSHTYETIEVLGKLMLIGNKAAAGFLVSRFKRGDVRLSKALEEPLYSRSDSDPIKNKILNQLTEIAKTSDINIIAEESIRLISQLIHYSDNAQTGLAILFDIATSQSQSARFAADELLSVLIGASKDFRKDTAHAYFGKYDEWLSYEIENQYIQSENVDEKLIGEAKKLKRLGHLASLEAVERIYGSTEDEEIIPFGSDGTEEIDETGEDIDNDDGTGEEYYPEDNDLAGQDSTTRTESENANRNTPRDEPIDKLRAGGESVVEPATQEPANTSDNVPTDNYSYNGAVRNSTAQPSTNETETSKSDIQPKDSEGGEIEEVDQAEQYGEIYNVSWNEMLNELRNLFLAASKNINPEIRIEAVDTIAECAMTDPRFDKIACDYLRRLIMPIVEANADVSSRAILNLVTLAESRNPPALSAIVAIREIISYCLGESLGSQGAAAVEILKNIADSSNGILHTEALDTLRSISATIKSSEDMPGRAISIMNDIDEYLEEI